MTVPPPAPELMVRRWFNSEQPLSLKALRGQVILIHAFQMLCPGCVLHAVPQTQRIAERVREPNFRVLGLHTVFEHHEAMGEAALAAFIHEFRLTFPIGVDAHVNGDPTPATMRAYRLRGTPSTLLIDHRGRLRLHEFGVMDDFDLGRRVGLLLAEAAADPIGTDRHPAPSSAQAGEAGGEVCDEVGCVLQPGRHAEQRAGAG
jgi:hypothetical protein